MVNKENKIAESHLFDAGNDAYIHIEYKSSRLESCVNASPEILAYLFGIVLKSMAQDMMEADKKGALRVRAKLYRIFRQGYFDKTQTLVQEGEENG